MPAVINARRRPRENTTSWVDEGYSQRLARQAVEGVRPADESAGKTLLTLASIRRSPLYLAERPGKVGFGMKRGTRVWHVDGADTFAGMGIYSLDYDQHGKAMLRSMFSPPSVVITRHALQRLFQRLRTNSFDEVARKALAPLVDLADPDRPGLEGQIVVVGQGHFVAVSEVASVTYGHQRVVWVLKTFIDKE